MVRGGAAGIGLVVDVRAAFQQVIEHFGSAFVGGLDERASQPSELAKFYVRALYLPALR